MRLLKRLPYVSILVLFWAGLRIADVNVTTANVMSWVVVLCAVGCLVYELFKSLDITIKSFMLDLLWAVLTFGLAIGLIVYIWQRRTVDLVDFVVIAISFLDVWLSSVISFSNALRNVQAGVNTAPQDVHDASAVAASGVSH